MAIVRIAHDIGTFELEPLGVKSVDLDTEAVVSGKIAAGGVGRTDDLADGILTADATGRGKMADEFINEDKLSYGVPIRVQATAVEALTDGDAIYLEKSGADAGKAGQAQANSSSTMNSIGVVDGDALSGTTATIVVFGLHSSSNYNFSGNMQPLYISPDTAGQLETIDLTTSGEIVQIGAYAVNGSTALVVGGGFAAQRGAGVF